MAFEPGHGRTAVPVRSALAGTATAVAAVTAAVVFGTSFLGLVTTPHRYGQNWAQQLDLQVGAAPAAVGAPVLAHAHTGLAGYAAGNYGQVSISGTAIPAIGLDQRRGSGFLTMLAGRPPGRRGEIVLGARTLAAGHWRIGQAVPVTANGRVRRMRITGTAVFPAFSVAGGSATDLGTGAAVPAAVLSQPAPPGCPGPQTCYNFFLLRYRPGTNLAAAAAAVRRAVTRIGCPPGLCLVTADQRPQDILDYASVRATPLVLGAVLALLAVGTLTHALVTGVRRRRRDLAVLKTLGLRRAQLLAVVSWQASALAAAALAVGIPLGAVAGRWAWEVFAGSLGAAPAPEVPVPWLLLVIPVTIALASLLAAGPGWAAARVSPALVLRAE
jgi:FtsX-like permease family/MacB-like periplasmic core domain